MYLRLRLGRGGRREPSLRGEGGLRCESAGPGWPGDEFEADCESSSAAAATALATPTASSTPNGMCTPRIWPVRPAAAQKTAHQLLRAPAVPAAVSRTLPLCALQCTKLGFVREADRAAARALSCRSGRRPSPLASKYTSSPSSLQLSHPP